VKASQSGPDKRRGDALARLEKATGSSWDAGFDAATGRARVLVGRAHFLRPAEPPAEAVKRFVAEHGDLFDTAGSTLELHGEREAEGRRIVSLARRVDGLRVVDDYVNASFVGDDLVDMQLVVSGPTERVAAATFDVPEPQARATAMAALAKSGADPTMLAAAKVGIERVRWASATLESAYEVTVDFEAADLRTRVIVSAQSGAVLRLDDGLAHDKHVTAQAVDARGDKRAIEVKQIYSVATNAPNQYELDDATTDNTTGRCNRIACPTAKNPFDPEAVSAHANARAARDAYSTVFGHQINSLESRVNYGGPFPWDSGTDNAAFSAGILSGGYLSYNITSPTDQYTTANLEIVGHEYTHGVTHYSSGLRYERESGALNESMSDVFAIFVKEYAQVHGYVPQRQPYGSAGFFEFGSLATKSGAAYRSLSNPARLGLPAHYSQKGSTTGDCSNNDHCFVHSNSSIPNHAFYLASEGGKNAISNKGPKQGVGRQNAWKIWHSAAFSTSLGAGATFHDFAKMTISNADAWAGTGNSLLGHTINCAWQSVGVNVYGNDACGSCNRPGSKSWSSVRSFGGSRPSNVPPASSACFPGPAHTSPTVAGALANGDRSCSSLSGESGADWYRIEGKRSVPVVLRLGGIRGDADLELYDGAGNVVATSAFAGEREELIDVTPDDDAALFARVVSTRGAASSYELSLDSDDVESCEDLPEQVPTGPTADTRPSCAVDDHCDADDVCSPNGAGAFCCRPKFDAATPTACDPGLASSCKTGEICGTGAATDDPALVYTCIDPSAHPCSATNP
jgi:Zn-dependent metalloprotease